MRAMAQVLKSGGTYQFMAVTSPDDLHGNHLILNWGPTLDQGIHVRTFHMSKQSECDTAFLKQVDWLACSAGGAWRPRGSPIVVDLPERGPREGLVPWLRRSVAQVEMVALRSLPSWQTEAWTVYDSIPESFCVQEQNYEEE